LKRTCSRHQMKQRRMFKTGAQYRHQCSRAQQHFENCAAPISEESHQRQHAHDLQQMLNRSRVAQTMKRTLSLSSRRESTKRDNVAAQSERGGEVAALRAVAELVQMPMHSDIRKASDCGHQKSEERWWLQGCMNGHLVCTQIRIETGDQRPHTSQNYEAVASNCTTYIS